jgi:hypothetical protein
MSAFRDLATRGLLESIAIAGETVTIGSWTGQAIVDGDGGNLFDVTGGVYSKSSFTILCAKSDLGGASVVPVEQMDVIARGFLLRIQDGGIDADVDSYLITVAGRNVPQ